MARPFDLSDVALVAAGQLAIPMRYLVSSGRGLVMLRGLSEHELRDLDAAVWDRLDQRSNRAAVLMRVRCMIQVFEARRLSQLLLQRGLLIIRLALEVAASMRLNARLGFNPLKFERELRMLLAAHDAQRDGIAHLPMAA
jgi:hypothetical protein